MRGGSLITPTPQVALLLETSTEYGRGLLRGIIRYSSLHGPWSLYVAPGHLEQKIPKARSWSGTGIIGRTHSSEIQKLIRTTGLPFVASSLDETLAPGRRTRFGEIKTDSEAIGRMGATHLADRNFRHFAFCGFVGAGWSSARQSAFSRCLKERGFDCQTQEVELTNWLGRENWIEHWERERPTLINWLKRLPKPVGLMACNDTCGREVLDACGAADLRVPDDVAVLGVDNDELMCEISNPPLSSIALDLGKAGYEAAGLLDALMSGRKKRGGVVMVEPLHVVVRQSTDHFRHDDPVVSAAVRFIKTYAGRAIGVSDVVEGVGVSRRTLERKFSQALGRSIRSEITKNRIERATRLLVATDIPSYSVAKAAGFGSVKSFNRMFTRAAGVSPSRFRQSSTA
jgi:LacI family transcriptional regulator